MSGDDDARALRLAKLAHLRSIGQDPFLCEDYPHSDSPAEVRENFADLEGKSIAIAGRVTALRTMGKAAFFDIAVSGDRLQIYIKKDDIGDTLWQVFELVDIGDIVGVQGQVFRTKMGEISVHARDLKVLAKCLHVLPIGKEKEGKHWYGLSDVEERYRKRYLDLLANAESRQLFITRSRIIAETRHFLDKRGFIEVETPILETAVGGAAARPFTTYHNALDLELKLRISLELHLKRLIIGGMDKVYEIGRVFRNEGISTRHNPEFTLLELYEAYAKMEDIQGLVEDLCKHLAMTVFGSERVLVRETLLDFSKPWRRVDLLTEIQSRTGIPPTDFDALTTAKAAMASVGLPSSEEDSVGGIIEKLLERFVEPHLREPTFVENYPIDTSPLAKRHPSNPRLTRRFEGYILGREICNAFSELNDPIDQRDRMRQQHEMLLAGKHEANPIDEDFLYAMECGMPPTGGLGIGMDRLVMVLTGTESIRDVILFPTMKPESQG